MRVTVVLPVPNNVLSPNRRRTHWAAIGKAKKKAREDARLATLAALSPHSSSRPMWPAATVSVRLVRQNRRHRWDNDNLIAACKAYIDGVVDAGLIANDRGVKWSEVVQDVEPMEKIGRIELTFAATGGEE